MRAASSISLLVTPSRPNLQRHYRVIKNTGYKPDIFLNGGCKQNRLLPHDPKLIPQPAHVQLSQIHPVQQYLRLCIVKF